MKERNLLERWHGAHHYPDKIHILLVLFLFLTVIALLLSYFTFHKSVYSNINYTSPTPAVQTTTPAPTPIPTSTPAMSPAPTCRPRPSCLDSIPACKIAETADMCPRASITPKQVACTMEAKLCPDGKTYVGRSGPNCEFSKCPTR